MRTHKSAQSYQEGAIMNTQKREFALGTYLVVRYPWACNVSGAAMCSDGKVRKLARIAETADTFFSTPATVRVSGKSVAGYVTVETAEGYSMETAADPAVLKFIAVTYRKNHALLPPGSWKKAAGVQS